MVAISTAEQINAAVLRNEIETLLIECAYCLDRGDFAALLENFTDDCEVFSPALPLTGPNWNAAKGKAKLTEYYASPPWSTSKRIMRHIVTNIRLRSESDEHVSGTATVIGYRYDGELVSPALPMMVGDYEDKYRKGSDNRWRIASRRVVIKFLSQDLLDQKYPDVWAVDKVET